MTQIIDRRFNYKNKSAVNRQRFLRRFKKQIKDAVDKAITKRNITDIGRGEKIVIPAKDIKEPIFQHGISGIHENVFPGNKNFVAGDRIPRPQASQAAATGSEASNQGEGVDDFVFEIDNKEFLELFFEDLALPDLVKKHLMEIPEYEYIKAGYSATGVPNNLSIIRSMRHATARRIALRAPYKKQLKEAEKKLKDVTQRNPNDPIIPDIKHQIYLLKEKINSIPFIDTIDLRFHLRTKQLRPSSKAVMFCLMDVSGSMDEVKKDMAKRFYVLLYLFLRRHYQQIDIVFIRHHTSAKEVDEQEFFYSRETGGTVVSSALELMRDIMQERYPASNWNIYAAQASDGDNWNADSPYCQRLLTEHILPYVQYFSYVEIMPRHHQSLWEAYSELQKNFQHFAMQHISHVDDIYPVFHELFKRKTT